MFLGLNIRSLRKYFDELQLLNDSLKEPPDIIALTETWLSPSDPLDFTVCRDSKKLYQNQEQLAKASALLHFRKKEFHIA